MQIKGYTFARSSKKSALFEYITLLDTCFVTKRDISLRLNNFGDSYCFDLSLRLRFDFSITLHHHTTPVSLLCVDILINIHCWQTSQSMHKVYRINIHPSYCCTIKTDIPITLTRNAYCIKKLIRLCQSVRIPIVIRVKATDYHVSPSLLSLCNAWNTRRHISSSIV